VTLDVALSNMQQKQQHSQFPPTVQQHRRGTFCLASQSASGHFRFTVLTYGVFTRSSKLPANVFKIHVLMLDVCWIVWTPYYVTNFHVQYYRRMHRQS